MQSAVLLFMHCGLFMILLYDLFYILTTDIQTSSKRDCLYGWLIWLMTKPEFIKSEL